MTGDSVKEQVIPRPGVARSVGVFNLVIGGALLLAGGWVAFVMVPFLRENSPIRIEPEDAQATADGLRQERLDGLRTKERKATNDAEKAKARDERLSLEAHATKLTDQVNFGEVNRDLSGLSPYLWADVVSGPVLNGLLVISGVGLVFLRNWARRLAVATAALKVVRLVALNGWLGFSVVPGVGRAIGALGRSDAGNDLLLSALGEGNQMLHASVTLTPGEIVQGINWVGYGYALMTLGLGAIYPAIVLSVLTRPSARAACSAAR